MGRRSFRVGGYPEAVAEVDCGYRESSYAFSSILDSADYKVVGGTQRVGSTCDSKELWELFSAIETLN